MKNADLQVPPLPLGEEEPGWSGDASPTVVLESEFMLSSEGQINMRDDQELGFVCTESQGEVC